MFPTVVNGVQAPAVEGDFADSNGRASVDAGQGAFVAGTAGITIGRFAWVDPSWTYANNFGAGAPTGFVARHQQALITNYLAEASMVQPGGFGVTLYSSGGYWVRNTGPSAVVIGQKAYANNANGTITFAATGTPPTSASVTAAIAANAVTGAIAVNTATGSISGQNLTVTAVGAGSVLGAGESVTGTGVATGTTILSQSSGTLGGVGVYVVNINQTVASTALTMSGGGLTVSAVTSGTLAVGQSITGTNVPAGSVITNLGTGAGGTGTYVTSVSGTAASTAITASGGTMTVSAVGSGAVVLNDTLTGTNVPAGTYVSGFLTGAGGTGTYLVSTGTAVSSTTITVAAGTETKFFAISNGAVGELVKMTSNTLG